MIDHQERKATKAASPDHWRPVIEPASPEEIAMAKERIKDYERDPSSFTPLSEIK